MKNKIILALCTKLAVNKTTLERAAYIHQLRSSLITNNDPALNDMLDVLEQKQWGELEAFLVKHETDNDVQKVLVDVSIQF